LAKKKEPTMSQVEPLEKNVNMSGKETDLVISATVAATKQSAPVFEDRIGQKASKLEIRRVVVGWVMDWVGGVEEGVIGGCTCGEGLDNEAKHHGDED
jgi:hypothetical protein